MAFAPMYDYNHQESQPAILLANSEDDEQRPSAQQYNAISQGAQSLTSWDVPRNASATENYEDPYWKHTTPTKSSHQRGWSGSTATFELSLEQPSQYSKYKCMNRQRQSSNLSSWAFEIITIFFAFGAVGGIIGVLAQFNNRPLPDWPYYITLNALISLLATVAIATTSISLHNGISQLKWIHFKESKVPLTDMEIFDEASRGTWGALKLLVTARGGYVLF
jgi:hypothetical protein